MNPFEEACDRFARLSVRETTYVYQRRVWMDAFALVKSLSVDGGRPSLEGPLPLAVCIQDCLIRGLGDGGRWGGL